MALVMDSGDCSTRSATLRTSSLGLGRAMAPLAAVLLALVGCAEQRTLDRKIYRVDGPDGRNYYRVRIISQAINSEADYQTGLFPAYAVDAFLGKAGALETTITDAEQELRRMLAEAQTQAFREYLAALQAGRDDDADVDHKAKRLRDLQQLPILTGAEGQPGDPAAAERGFARLGINPLRNLVDYTANKKYVIAFSADPDAILEQISAFAEEAETTKAINNAVNGLLVLASGVDLDEIRTQNAELDRIGGEMVKLGDEAQVHTLTDLLALIQAASSKVENLP